MEVLARVIEQEKEINLNQREWSKIIFVADNIILDVESAKITHTHKISRTNTFSKGYKNQHT